MGRGKEKTMETEAWISELRHHSSTVADWLLGFASVTDAVADALRPPLPGQKGKGWYLYTLASCVPVSDPAFVFLCQSEDWQVRHKCAVRLSGAELAQFASDPHVWVRKAAARGLDPDSAELATLCSDEDRDVRAEALPRVPATSPVLRDRATGEPAGSLQNLIASRVPADSGVLEAMVEAYFAAEAGGFKHDYNTIAWWVYETVARRLPIESPALRALAEGKVKWSGWDADATARVRLMLEGPEKQGMLAELEK
jgi:hypothetical protein